MPVLKLTKAAVEKVPAPDPSGRQVVYWDTELKGFGLLASGKTTSKSFVAQRRMPNGKAPRVTVGAVGEFAKVEDARRKAGSVIAGLREGKDPKAERRKVAARNRSLRTWFDRYLAFNKELRPRSIEEYRRSVERHLGSWLDDPLRDITREMVEERHATIGATSGKATADAAMRALRVVWNFALDRDETLPANPVRVLKKRGWFRPPPRTRMVRMDELARFYAAVEELPNRTARDYILLLLFTGLRRREAAALSWDEVDLATKVIRLPRVRAKGKRKLDLPMSSFVRDLLVARRNIGNDGPFVFNASSRSGHIEEPRFAFDQIAQATAIRVSPHDLRRTHLTVAEAADISALALKGLANHAVGGGDVTEGYVQLTVERLRGPAQRVCDRMMDLCAIVAPEGENVARVGKNKGF
jgi:integrase